MRLFKASDCGERAKNAWEGQRRRIMSRVSQSPAPLILSFNRCLGTVISLEQPLQIIQTSWLFTA